MIDWTKLHYNRIVSIFSIYLWSKITLSSHWIWGCSRFTWIIFMVILVESVTPWIGILMMSFCGRLSCLVSMCPLLEGWWNGFVQFSCKDLEAPLIAIRLCCPGSFQLYVVRCCRCWRFIEWTWGLVAFSRERLVAWPYRETHSFSCFRLLSFNFFCVHTLH